MIENDTLNQHRHDSTTATTYEATAAIAVFGSDATIENNAITNSAGGIEANTDSTAGRAAVTVTGNYIFLALTVVANGALGIDVASLAAGSVVSDNTVDFTGGTGNDIGIVDSFDQGAITISSNTVTGIGADDGMLLYQDSTAVSVTGNTIQAGSAARGARDSGHRKQQRHQPLRRRGRRRFPRP